MDMDAKGRIIRQVLRSIVRHVRYIDEPELCADIKVLKKQLQKQPRPSTPRLWRRKLTDLFNIERELQQIENGKLTVLQFRESWRLLAPSRQVRERNQGSRVHIWLQHDARRFDEYNAPPVRGSPQFFEVDRASKFADVSNRFAQAFGVSADSITVRTVFAPYWKQSTRKREQPLRPRPVEIRSIKRSSGILSLLRVRGVPMRARGLRRHIDNVDKSRHERIAEVEFQLWLANQYMEDPLDGEDMSDWISHLSKERQRLRRELLETTNKLEVQRRILLRRRRELERDWEWRYRRHMEKISRDKQLNPPPLLTLNTL